MDTPLPQRIEKEDDIENTLSESETVYSKRTVTTATSFEDMENDQLNHSVSRRALFGKQETIRSGIWKT